TGMDKPPTDANTTLTANCTATTFVFRDDQVPTSDEKQGKQGRNR
ncbi:MAG: hypothetical protein H6Q07_1396, partial [Acidobacteria bacterium]|nr:hypothetical protein [Acidobacteriota bacterium]